MRKFLATLGLALVSMMVMSAPALAQRDPFDPVIDPNAGTVTTDGGTGTTTGTDDGTGVPDEIGSEAIANTGADVAPFLVVAFTLVALGGIALAWARLNGPPLHRS